MAKQRDITAVANMLQTALFLAYGSNAKKTTGKTDRGNRHTTWFFPLTEGGLTVAVEHEPGSDCLTIGAFLQADGDASDIAESFNRFSEFRCCIDNTYGAESPVGTIARATESIGKMLQRLGQCGIWIKGTR